MTGLFIWQAAWRSLRVKSLVRVDSAKHIAKDVLGDQESEGSGRQTSGSPVACLVFAHIHVRWCGGRLLK